MKFNPSILSASPSLPVMMMMMIMMMMLASVIGYPQNGNRGFLPEDQQLQSSSGDDSDMYMEAAQEQTERSSLEAEPSHGSQTLYPSFGSFQDPPLGHSRPFYYQQEGAYSHKPSVFQQQVDYDTNTRFSGYKGDRYSEPAASADANNLLGSGNFVTLKGGTFYNDNDGESSSYSDNYNYYQNGHGRPSASFYFGNGNPPRPQRYQQFDNFRDFADINTPSNPEYSQFVVVYANKNDTTESVTAKPSSAPKNIIEQLAMLDLEATTSTTTTESIPVRPKKVSGSKRKLALLLPEKKQKRKDLLKSRTTTSRETYEPLLALS